MQMTSCVRHREKVRFFIKFEDILDLCDGDHAKCAAHRVLEARTDARFAAWRELGNQDEPPEDFLWFVMRWEDFVDWSLSDRETTSFRRALPEIEMEGFVKRRYVKVDERSQVVRDERGRTYAYDTYKQAAADHRVEGIIMNQYLYLYQAVNKQLDSLYQPSPSPSPSDPDNEKEKEQPPEGVTSNAAASTDTRGGNLQRTGTCANSSITPCQKQQGSTDHTTISCRNEQDPPVENDTAPVNFDITPVEMSKTPCRNEQDPPVENDNKKHYYKESVNHDTESMVPCGTDEGLSRVVSQTNDEARIWNAEMVLYLAERLLAPLPDRIKAAQKAANALRWQEAAQRIEKTLRDDWGMADVDAAEYLVRLLLFVTDATSPCHYRRFVERQIGRPLTPRLWHLADNLLMISRDLDATAWQPGEAATITADVEASVDRDPEPVMTPELPQGMSREDAACLVEEIHTRYPDLPVRGRRLPDAILYHVQIRTGTQAGTITFLSPGEYFLWQEQQQQLGDWKAAS